MEFPPGASTGDVPHAHEGEEVHVVKGGSMFGAGGRHGNCCLYQSIQRPTADTIFSKYEKGSRTLLLTLVIINETIFPRKPSILGY